MLEERRPARQGRCMTLVRRACMVVEVRRVVPPEEVRMRRGMIVWLGLVVLLAGAGMANARAERELTDDELRAEMAQNRAMAAYVAPNGDPDLAESHVLADV